MKVLFGVDRLAAPLAGSSLAIGTFDGVHLGHRALIAGATAAGRTAGSEAGVVTWDRHPAETLRPDRKPPLLTSLDRKLELLTDLDVDLVAVVPFDEELSSWAPETFVARVLVRGLAARHVSVGHDWRFGHGAAGDVDLLAKLGVEHGFEVEGVRLEELADEPVSSSRIRRALGDGDVELGRALLGRPFDIDGIVIRGDGRGATLGYPTANLDVDAALARPARGVYAGRIRVDDRWYRAAVNVGKNPTFGGAVLRVEVYILDFEEDIYGRSVRLEFWHRLRDELKFDSVEALVERMRADVDETRSSIPAT